jgi:hypothetical protein
MENDVTYSGHLKYFTTIGYILWAFGNFVDIGYIFPRFGICIVSRKICNPESNSAQEQAFALWLNEAM